MSRKPKKRRRSGKRRPGPGNRVRRGDGDREWIGAVLTPPFLVTDREKPYRPAMIVWMDVRDGLVVGHRMVPPEEVIEAFGRGLLEAIARPLAGPPRRPSRIRVPDRVTATVVRAVLEGTLAIPVEIAPTPELDELLAEMIESFQEAEPEADSEDSYLENGRLSPTRLARFFEAAQRFYQLAPWKGMTDDQVLRVDIPDLGVRGACVSIMGNLGESLGMLIFPSLVGYEAFLGAAEEFTPGRMGRADFGTDWLALSFERGADLPSRMRREIAEHGWPIADAKGHPRIVHCERDGAIRPLTETEIEIFTACATSLTAFFAKHGDLFERDEFEPVCESYFNEEDLELIVTVPYEAFELFGLDTAPTQGISLPSSRLGTRTPPVRKVGRNAPCPCGSGRKYKKCHESIDEAARKAGTDPPEDDDLEAQLVDELSEFAMQRFGSQWRPFVRDFFDASEVSQLAVPWSVYHFHVQGKSVLERYLDAHGRELSRRKRAWLAAQQASWLSTWEVTAVEPGIGMTLRDLLSFEERRVREVSASQTLVVRDVLLGRVVDHDGESLLCGIHPRSLPPREAAEVVRRARGRLRRKRAVPLDRLRDERFGRYLIKRWEEAVLEFDERLATPPEIQNSDGDPLLLTTDYFAFSPDRRAELLMQFSAMEGVDSEGTEGVQDRADPAFVFLGPGKGAHAASGQTLLGRVCFEDDSFRVDTNSIERADALRARIETACGDLVRHRARDHTDPTSSAVMKEAAEAADLPRLPPDRTDAAEPAELTQLVLDFKRRHYADWSDQALPALGGRTAREAIATADGRNAVDVLLKEMENNEQRFARPGNPLFDFGTLRRELGLDS